MEKPPALTTDPLLAAQEQQAQRDQADALKVQASGDTASLMARYGMRLAQANAVGGSPLMPSAIGLGMGRGRAA